MIPLVVNDLSLVASTDITQARARMELFLRCVAMLGTLGAREKVRIKSALDSIDLAPQYPIGVWRGDQDVDLELRRLYNSRIGTGPYLTEDEIRGLRGEEIVDVQIGGRSGSGLEHALLLNGIVLSVDSMPPWDVPELEVQVARADSFEDVNTSPGTVRNVSNLDHVEYHRSWIEERINRIDDDEDLWARRSELFPHLRFCPAVRGDLRVEARNRDRFRAIIGRLKELDEFVGGWEGGQFDANSMRSKCTPETPKSLKDNASALTRECDDGIRRVFNYHLRYTPNAGRLYFEIDAAGRVAHVGFICEKFVN